MWDLTIIFKNNVFRINKTGILTQVLSNISWFTTIRPHLSKSVYKYHWGWQSK